MKKQIRKEMLQKRKELSQKEVSNKSHLIYEKLNQMNLLNESNTLVYMDFRNEVQTKEILEKIIDNVGHVLLPRVEGQVLTIHRIESFDDLILSGYGILEPQSKMNIVDYDAINCILAPGVAFDYNGYRLGYGGGFYDKLLSNKRKEVPVIALAFDVQIIDKVPTEPHDFQMNMIVTESQIIQSSNE